MNLLRATAIGGVATAGDLVLPVPGVPDGDVVLGLRPEHLRPAVDGEPGMEFQVDVVEPLGDGVIVHGTVSGQVATKPSGIEDELARLSRRSRRDHDEVRAVAHAVPRRPDPPGTRRPARPRLRRSDRRCDRRRHRVTGSPVTCSETPIERLTNVRLGDDEAALSWFGQASFAARGGGTTVLFDPFLSPYDGRLHESPLAPDGVPSAIDVVFCSHEHVDHLDVPSIGAIATASPGAVFVVPSPIVDMVTEAGVPADRVVGMQPGGSDGRSAA